MKTTFQQLRRLTFDARGAVAVELAFAGPLMFMLAFGSFYLGVNFDRYLSMQQLSRAAANMHSRGADFNLSGAQQQLRQAAPGLDYDSTTGDTIVYMTAIAQTPTGPRVVERFSVGRETVAPSKFGVVAPGPNGEVDPPAAVDLPEGVTIPEGRRIYVSEVAHRPNLSGFPWAFSKTYLLRASTFF